MKLLANENIPLASIVLLRDAGHDVLCLSLQSPGITDEHVMAMAREQGRIIVTFDRDYGELLYRHSLPVPPGVLYLRMLPASPFEVAQVLLDLFQQKIGIEGYFVVVERDHVRRRPLPQTT